MAQVKTNATLALVVEDDPATRALEEIVLEADGFAVLTAKNGEEGIQLARECCPAVILLDLALPTASGFDVLKTLKGASDTHRFRSCSSVPTRTSWETVPDVAPPGAYRSRLTSTSWSPRCGGPWRASPSSRPLRCVEGVQRGTAHANRPGRATIRECAAPPATVVRSGLSAR